MNRGYKILVRCERVRALRESWTGDVRRKHRSHDYRLTRVHSLAYARDFTISLLLAVLRAPYGAVSHLVSRHTAASELTDFLFEPPGPSSRAGKESRPSYAITLLARSMHVRYFRDTIVRC